MQPAVWGLWDLGLSPRSPMSLEVNLTAACVLVLAFVDSEPGALGASELGEQRGFGQSPGTNTLLLTTIMLCRWRRLHVPEQRQFLMMLCLCVQLLAMWQSC
jgi:hypothetical protein